MDNPPVLVVAAVREELNSFTSPLGGGVHTLVTGMGAGRAHERVSRWLSQHPCRCVVSVGFAGGTQAGLRTGDLIVPNEVFDASSGDKQRPSRFSIGNGACVRVGPLVTNRRVLLTPRAKGTLGRRFQALAVDMETWAVAKAAMEADLPWISVRAILDPMEEFLFSPWILMNGMRKASRELGMYLNQWVERIP